MDSQEQRDNEDCTVAVCRCGGAVIMAVTAVMSRETMVELGEAAADGCEIKHMPAAEARRLPFGCSCLPRQAALAFGT